jgi:site-specific DNA-methyltransferase (adenine-specific)
MTTAEATGYAFKSGNVARWQRHRGNPIQRTPDALFRKLNDEFHFTLDAAATANNAKCEQFFTGERVWLNPPFGRGMREWVRKAWESSRAGALVVMLVPSATDMDWWHDYVLEADEVRFIRGRASFGSEDLTRSNYVFPISIVVFRPRQTGERVSLALA